MNKTRLALNLILLGLVLAFFGYAMFVFFKMDSVFQIAGQKNAFFGDVLPVGRASGPKTDDAGHKYMEISGQPVYFTLKPKAGARKVTLDFEYENSSVTNVSVGLQINSAGGYDYQAIENKTIDALNKDEQWLSQFVDDSYWLFWRKSLPKTTYPMDASDILNTLNDSTKLALFNFDVKPFYRMPNYRPAGVESIYRTALQGKHVILTYIKNETLNWSFDVVSDSVCQPDYVPMARVFNSANELVATSVNSGTLGACSWYLGINKPSLPEGVYKIEVSLSDAQVIKRWHTNQTKWVISNKLWLAGRPHNTNTSTVLANGAILSMSTASHEGLQTMKVDDQSLVIDQAYHQKKSATATALGKWYEVFSPSNAVIMQGRSLFALDEKTVFNPNFLALDAANVSLTGVDYVLARYHGGKTVSFDLANAYVSNGQMKFSLAGEEISDQTPIKLYSIKASWQ